MLKTSVVVGVAIINGQCVWQQNCSERTETLITLFEQQVTGENRYSTIILTETLY